MIALVATLVAASPTVRAETFDPYASALDEARAVQAGLVTSEQLIRRHRARIARLDPSLRSVLALNPRAMAQAKAIDIHRDSAAGPLTGVPVLIKDNIETADLATTAGSLAMLRNDAGRDAPLVARLKAAGAVILGKTNLSEWANFRSTRSVSGWSAVGGLTRNPWAPDHSACGSSAGSAVAVAAGLAAAAIGTETDGSIICPAAANGVVGLKPTLGLVSRAGIVPISPAQDTAGPMARSVADVAAILTVIAGSDPADPATREADARKADYLAALDAHALQGARIGVLRLNAGRSPATDAVFEEALTTLRRAGAILVEVDGPDKAHVDAMEAAEGQALNAEFKAAITAYLASTPPSVTTRTLAELIAFSEAEPREHPLFGQEIFEAAASAPDTDAAAAITARALARRLAGPEGLDRMLAGANVEAVVGPSGGPAPLLDLSRPSSWAGSYSSMPAIAGYPHLTVPMGQVEGLPVGLSLIGPAWSDARVLSLGYAFEQARGLPRRHPPLPRGHSPPRRQDARK